MGIEKYFSYIVIKSSILKSSMLLQNLPGHQERSGDEESTVGR